MANKDNLISVSRNARQLISVISPLLPKESVDRLELEISNHAKDLFRLGEHHSQFAEKLTEKDWRQMVSRSYYGAYNCRRALMLYKFGSYSTDPSDHKKVAEIPEDFPEKETRSARLRDLREDRNTADYDHSATVDDLIITPREAVEFSKRFIQDAKKYFSENGFDIESKA